MTRKVGQEDVTPEEEERARKIREQYERDVKDTHKNPPGFYRQPDKFDPMPHHDPARADLDVIERIIAPSAPRRLLGALLGLAVGDALGTTLEFQRIDAPAFPALARGPHRSITGGGPFNLVPGQVTDDTQMACCLFESLLAARGLDPADLGRRYVAWARHAFDIGNQTAAALGKVGQGAPPVHAGRAVWEARGRQAAGNGSLMRTAPIGVLLSADEALRRRASLVDSAITHFDPRCQLACAAFNAVIARAVQRDPATRQDLVVLARRELDAAAGLLRAEYPDLSAIIDEARADLWADLDAAEADDPHLYGPEIHIHKQQGFVRVAFRLAFWELLHAPDFETALIDVVNRGGDADTNGAIAGALLGAVYSLDAIPRSWVDMVLRALEQSADSPFRTDYHPRLFVQGLEKLYQAPLLPDSPPSR